MKCTECGHENSNSPRYCTRCGSPLDEQGAQAGQRRETKGADGLFDAPPRIPPPPPPPSMGAARAVVGNVRKTSLDDGFEGAPPPMPGARRTVLEEAGQSGGAGMRYSGPVPMGARGKTILDEGPVASPAGQHGADTGAIPAPGTARIIGWMVSFDRNVAGQAYVLRAGRNRIGRSRDNDVSLFYEPKASDLHATIIWRNNTAAVKDEGSTNGTVVNGEDIGIAQVSPLASGDTLAIGGSTFLVFLIDARTGGKIWPSSPWAA